MLHELVQCHCTGRHAQDVTPRSYFHRHLETKWPWNQEQLQAFLRPFAHDNTIFIVPVNDAYVDLGRNGLCSLNALDAADKHRHLVFWALDLGAVEALQKLRKDLHADFGIIFTPELYAGKDMQVGTDEYYRTMRERGKFWSHILQSGFNMLFGQDEESAKMNTEPRCCYFCT